jgi:hypothetical protein
VRRLIRVALSPKPSGLAGSGKQELDRDLDCLFIIAKRKQLEV